MRAKNEGYFKKSPGAPNPISFEIKRRVSFNEVDIMGIVWYGQYAIYFEQAQTELGRRCGLSFQDFYLSNIRAPIVKFHIDYYQPLYLDEEFTVRASYVWSEGAKLHIEYAVIKNYLNYIIRNKPHIITKELLCFIENIMHCQDCKNMYHINYSLIRLSSFHKMPHILQTTI